MTKPKPHPRDVGYSDPPSIHIEAGAFAVPDGLAVCRTCGKTVIDDEEAARLRQDSKP